MPFKFDMKKILAFLARSLRNRNVQIGLASTAALAGGYAMLRKGEHDFGGGMWLWSFERCPEKFDWQAYVDTAKWAKLDHIVGPKISEGSSWMNEPNHIIEFCKAFKGTGIELIPWHYLYCATPESPELEAESLWQKLQKIQEASGYKFRTVCLNAEQIALPGYKGNETIGGWADKGLKSEAVAWYKQVATRFTSHFKKISGMEIGISTYARLDMHNSFPYAEFFANGATIFMPQSYWCSDKITLGKTTRDVAWWTKGSEAEFRKLVGPSDKFKFFASPPGYIKVKNTYGNCRERGNYETLMEFFSMYKDGTIWEWGDINKAGSPHGERNKLASSEIWTALRDR